MMVEVDDIDDMLERLNSHGTEPVGEIIQYEDAYRFMYLRGPKGTIVALAESFGSAN